jgi:hypothetical protein
VHVSPTQYIFGFGTAKSLYPFFSVEQKLFPVLFVTKSRLKAIGLWRASAIRKRFQETVLLHKIICNEGKRVRGE